MSLGADTGRVRATSFKATPLPLAHQDITDRFLWGLFSFGSVTLYIQLAKMFRSSLLSFLAFSVFALVETLGVRGEFVGKRDDAGTHSSKPR